MKFENYDVLNVWHVERKMSRELWLVMLSAIGLTLVLHYMAPEAKAQPSPVTPRVAQELGWCEVKK
jgi:hypothetical protein